MEFRNFGWNALTVSFLGTVFFTILRAWAYWKQGRAIWRQRSGQSVPVVNYTYLTVAAAAMFVYGVETESVALIFNGSASVLFRTSIVVGLWKFKGFSRIEKILTALFIVGLAVVISIDIDPRLLMAFLVGTVFVSLLQPFEIWRNRDAGVDEIRLLVVGLVNSLFWLVYAFACDDWALKLINPCFTALSLVTIVLWICYRPGRIKAGSDQGRSS